MDLLLVPERSSLKHQRYDNFELMDELKSRPRNHTTKAINFDVINVKMIHQTMLESIAEIYEQHRGSYRQISGACGGISCGLGSH
jgi:hypothetical protein